MSRYGKRREALRSGREYLIDHLGSIRDDWKEEFAEITRDLAARRSEHDSILANRARLIHAFNQHQEHLERVGRVLLATYRDANTAARSTKPPKRFGQAWGMDRAEVHASLPGEFGSDELRARVAETEDYVTAEVKEIFKEYERALVEYERLDEHVLSPEMSHAGQAT